MIDDETLPDQIDEGYEDDYSPDTLFDTEPEAEPVADDLSAPLTRAEFFEALKQFQAPQQPPQQFQQALNDSFYDPTFEARKAMRLEEEMIAEVNAMYPDLPADAKADIRNRIGSYRTYEDLQAAKVNKVHELLADAKASELFRKGKYVPASLRTVAKPSPVNTERPKQISGKQKSELDEWNAVLKQYGVQIDEADLKGKR